jgi:predicted RNA binding protein YcfA (HicA-like mRNA interferase family)
MERWSKRDIQKILKINGWTLCRCSGSHKIYTNASRQHMSVPESYNNVIMLRLFKQYNISYN